MSEKLHLTAFSKDELTEFVERIGEPRFRARQIFKQIHERRLLNFD
jgi:adenine C2-methylase RlmN of 23S rRNA A2503 and tRNA A37